MTRVMVSLARVGLVVVIAGAGLLSIGAGPAAAVCETQCPPKPGIYSVSGTLSASTLRWTGSAGVSGPTSGRIGISFAVLPPGLLHPPSPCDLGVVGVGGITAKWDDGSVSSIAAVAIHLPAVLLPTSPVFGVGVVTSGALGRDIVTFNWIPPNPVCPGTTNRITGTMAFTAPA